MAKATGFGEAESECQGKEDKDENGKVVGIVGIVIDVEEGCEGEP